MRGLFVRVDGLAPRYRTWRHPDTGAWYVMERDDTRMSTEPGKRAYLFLPPAYRTEGEALDRLKMLNKLDRFK
ncbi:MAG: hypothetical protein ACI35Q_09500 [Marinilabiliaceae bacterium]